MKKKVTKKLELKKETLQSLSPNSLSRAMGGTGWWTTPEYTCQNEYRPEDSAPCG